MNKVDKKIAQAIHDEHEAIKTEMDKLREMIATSPAQEAFAEWKLELLMLLRDFESDLQKHFDLEEEGGFMKDVLDKAPQKWHAVSQLKTEHEAINEEMSNILKELKAAENAKDLKVDYVRDKLNEVLDLIVAHEMAENDLLNSTYLQDDGMGD